MPDKEVQKKIKKQRALAVESSLSLDLIAMLYAAPLPKKRVL